MISTEEENRAVQCLYDFIYYFNKKLIILSIILFIIFLGLSIYIYMTYIKPRIFNNYVPNSEFVDPGKDNKIIIMYFYTEWCPNCKTALPEWTKFKNKVNKRTFDIPIIFKEIDCDIYTEVADEYNIEGYPTIKLLYKKNVYDLVITFTISANDISLFPIDQ